MGGKGGSEAAPAPIMPPVQDNSAEMANMMGMMMGMMQNTMQNMPQTPQLPSMPEVRKEPVIDWAERNNQLLAKTKADYGVEAAGKKGRSSTILTSPLLDEEDPSTTQSLLTGTKK